MMRIMTVLGAGLIGLMHPAASQATLLDFTFSFTGTVPPGNVAGTVTGEIFGLTEGATSSATNLILDSYPAGLEPPAPPLTVFTDVNINSFTVDATGDITAATYEGSGGTTNHNLLLFLNNQERDNENGLLNNDDEFLQNFDGFTGVTYTLVPSILEPSSVTLLGTGLGLAALWQLRRRRQRGAAA